jgi:hypothetical protein
MAGYDGIHIMYVGKKDDGSRRYMLANRSGTPRDGSPEFDGYDSATAYCTQNNIELKRFTDILGYARSSTTTADW